MSDGTEEQIENEKNEKPAEGAKQPPPTKNPKQLDLIARLDAYAQKEKEALNMSLETLNEDFTKQANGYLNNALRYHRAEHVLALKKVEKDKIEAEVYFEAKGQGGDKKTEATLKHQIAMDMRVINVKQLIALCEYQSSVYQDCMRAWEHKRDMLIQVGSTQRAEFQANVSINKPSQDTGAPPKPRGGRGRHQTI